MASYGYSYVVDKGFSAFSRELDEGPWKNISIKNYDTPDRKPITPLAEAPLLTVLKLRVVWVIHDLDEALGSSADKLAQCDGEWDAAQRSFHYYLASEQEHKDQNRRAAAIRIRGALLAGAGTEQTRYSYDEEVDFGYQQLSRARKAPLVDDANLLGLDSHLQRIEDATNALAKALGREPGQKRALAPSRRLRDATTACRTTFNLVHDTLAFLVEHTLPGKERERLEALHAPFLALLERYPAPAKAAPQADEPAQEGGGTTN